MVDALRPNKQSWIQTSMSQPKLRAAAATLQANVESQHFWARPTSDAEKFARLCQTPERELLPTTSLLDMTRSQIRTARSITRPPSRYDRDRATVLPPDYHTMMTRLAVNESLMKRENQAEVGVSTRRTELPDGTVALKHKSSFAYHDIRDPPIRTVELSRIDSVPEHLRTPAERRESMRLETLQNQARLADRKSRSEQRRTQMLLSQRSMSENPPHSVFEQEPIVQRTKQKAMEIMREHEDYMEGRRSRIERTLGSGVKDVVFTAGQPGFSPILDKTMTSKGRVAGPSQTFSFEWMQSIPTPPRTLESHAQEIRNHHTAGRQYNILAPDSAVSHTKPSIPERINARQAHPSVMIGSQKFRA